ncbi:futalosine hydrolase [Bacillus solitudinis]|uniref:futalosine hydrolase n=1 Tax=Bacillus solitudinis TaxID=2014074 RepID=UPI000C23600D|nr:futalosine hydrolase [Bacillus solitudinis]
MIKDDSETTMLIVTSVLAEKEAVLRGLGQVKGVQVEVVGVGIAAAAANTAVLLATATRPYNCVINAGIAGGFSGKATVGSLVVATEIVAADLGAETSEGFQSIEDLKLTKSRVRVEDRLVDSLVQRLTEKKLEISKGPILTLSTVTGTSTTAEELAIRVPGAVAEAMEGYGVAVAAEQAGIPVCEVRSISNMVGPRDREAWRLQEALAALESASSVFAEVLR